MSVWRKPDAAALTKTLAMLVDANASAAESSDIAGDVSHHGLWVDADGKVEVQMVCTLSAAAGLGAGLSMIPPGAVEAMLEDGALTDSARGNLYECMNVFTTLLLDDRTPHLRLESMGDGLPAPLDADDAIDLAFQLDLGRYGTGAVRFSLR